MSPQLIATYRAQGTTYSEQGTMTDRDASRSISRATAVVEHASASSSEVDTDDMPGLEPITDPESAPTEPAPPNISRMEQYLVLVVNGERRPQEFFRVTVWMERTSSGYRPAVLVDYMSDILGVEGNDVDMWLVFCTEVQDSLLAEMNRALRRRETALAFVNKGYYGTVPEVSRLRQRKQTLLADRETESVRGAHAEHMKFYGYKGRTIDGPVQDRRGPTGLDKACDEQALLGSMLAMSIANADDTMLEGQPAADAPHPTAAPSADISSAASNPPRRTVAGYYANPARDTLARVDVPVVFQHDAGGVGQPGWEAQVAPYVSEPPGVVLVPYNDLLNRRRCPLVIYYDVNAFVTAGSANRCITALTARRDPEASPWCGAVLVLKLDSARMIQFVDVKAKDKKDIQGFFARYRY
ncbi:hypothetical protein K466DRAFT_563777 [Polyporus arcularius HHB13444]|uniref:Uncharacterized protein n=1 Tax=Polyporus arcularius HHB13444 TaxID=1314778 RepID=A0A5C3PL84_9APHY|nr:hypothetical protein K466DRAFT_563777 [Polyporus arcularius HHB13444]